MSDTRSYDAVLREIENLKRFYELARSEEREACAQICEQFADQDSGPDGIVTDYHAHLIRARGNK